MQDGTTFSGPIQRISANDHREAIGIEPQRLTNSRAIAGRFEHVCVDPQRNLQDLLRGKAILKLAGTPCAMGGELHSRQLEQLTALQVVLTNAAI